VLAMDDKSNPRMRNLLREMDMFVILIMMIVSQVYTYAKTYRSNTLEMCSLYIPSLSKISLCPSHPDTVVKAEVPHFKRGNDILTVNWIKVVTSLQPSFLVG
jgi:hypothetical protein